MRESGRGSAPRGPSAQGRCAVDHRCAGSTHRPHRLPAHVWGTTETRVGAQGGDVTKYVYDFAEGNRDLKDLLGGKGANLAEMTNLGLPVPPGFTITTEACQAYLTTGSLPG